MNGDELGRTFGVDNSSQVDDYEVIYIRRHRIFKHEDPLEHDEVSPRKRSGPHDNHAHFSFSASGKYDFFRVETFSQRKKQDNIQSIWQGLQP